MCVGVECREVAMWVWSDELVERVSIDGVEAHERVPLVAYAVGAEVDLDEFASEILNATRANAVEVRQAPRGAVDR